MQKPIEYQGFEIHPTGGREWNDAGGQTPLEVPHICRGFICRPGDVDAYESGKRLHFFHPKESYPTEGEAREALIAEGMAIIRGEREPLFSVKGM